MGDYVLVYTRPLYIPSASDHYATCMQAFAKYLLNGVNYLMSKSLATVLSWKWSVCNECICMDAIVIFRVWQQKASFFMSSLFTCECIHKIFQWYSVYIENRGRKGSGKLYSHHPYYIIYFRGCDKTPWPKVTYRRKSLFAYSSRERERVHNGGGTMELSDRLYLL